ncbi:Uncharacterised protein [Escherichia coli]|uniref:Uncharacterized protein n=1 Tax=Escherichia coli TaxID=562 RepID=A0A377CYH3_ECOLX|nr:Uncharacterised protein [Escherichia coli]
MLIEAKCSRADLLADRKKRFRKNPSLGMGDWRFFISEPELFQLRIYLPAGDYFTLLTEEYGKYMDGPGVIAVGVILTISHLLGISRLNAITCYLH